MRDPSDYWSEFADQLTALGADPVLIGGIAANFYRQDQRLTTDVDFLVRSTRGVADALRSGGADVRELSEAGGEPYLLLVRTDDIQVDALLAETDYQREAHRRAEQGVLTVEDVIIHKLIAWRSRDRNDIESILAAGHTLDEAYIARWATEWDALDKWHEATNHA